MRIEIFVVTTEINRDITRNAYWTELEALKADIIRYFGGLTETAGEIGYWFDKDFLCSDTVKRWIIYTGSPELDRKPSFRLETKEKLFDFNKRIKAITKQVSQAFAINETLYLT